MAQPEILIITGGGRGIGAATARLAAQQGYSVCVNFLRDHVAANTVVRSLEDSGARAIAVQADIAIESEIVRLFETVDQKLGCVTALVNNAVTLEPQMR